MTLQEKVTIIFLIEISLLEAYKMEKICSSVAAKKMGLIKCFSCLTGNLKVTYRNFVYNQQGEKTQKECVDGKEVYGT